MTQAQYESIIDCIKFGNPASANVLITAFSEVIQSLQKFELKAEQEKKEEAKKSQPKPPKE